MKLTKYEHACIVLELDGQKLVIDPGSFSSDFGKLDDISAVIITHIHADHFSPENIEQIVRHNPDVHIFTTAGVADKLSGMIVSVAHDHAKASIGPFDLHFLGETHHLIHQSLPRPHNIGVLVNDCFFYPGDSFTEPDRPIEMLAVPANAPWASVAESMDYIATVQPQRCIPTHNGLLSENGHLVYNASLEHMCKAQGVEFLFLQPGEATELGQRREEES